MNKAGIEGQGETYTWTKDKKAPLYICRKVQNAEQIHMWYKTQGLSDVIVPEELHTTVVYSTTPVEWHKTWIAPEGHTIMGGNREHAIFGEPGDETFVLKMEDKYLADRHHELKERGCTSKWPNYHPHISLSKGMAVPVDSVDPYPGPIYLGPEHYEDIWENYEPEMKGFWDDPIIFEMPCIIKAREDGGRRLIQVEASCQRVDLEGDVIMQKALLNSAESFIRSGHLDIDHKSEPAIAKRYGITNPEHYIVGRPTEVLDGGEGRTFVRGELSRSHDGSFDPEHRLYDMVWDSLRRTPPVTWFASIFGYPEKGLTKNCQNGNCEMGARRFLIEGMNWKSLALTRNPVNNALRGEAKIITMKAWMEHIEKGLAEVPMPSVMPGLSLKSCMEGGHGCNICGPVLQKAPSLPAWRRHFMACSAMDPEMADLCAHGVSHKRLMDSLI